MIGIFVLASTYSVCQALYAFSMSSTQDYENVLSKISHSGVLYRWILTALLGLTSLKSAFDMLLTSLATVHVPFHCDNVLIDNMTLSWKAANASYDISDFYENFTMLDYTCTMPEFTLSANNSLELQVSTISKKCERWIFRPANENRWSLFMEFEMVCDRAYLVNRLHTLAMGGTLTAVLLGYTADILGRRKSIIVFTYLDFVCASFLILVPNLEVQMALRFFMGFRSVSVLSGIILLTEVVSEDYRGIHGNLVWLLWVVGLMMSPAVAYLIPNWRFQILFVLCLLSPGYVSFIFLIPESPRWILTRNKPKEAKEAMEKICRFSRCKDAVMDFDFYHNDLLKSAEENDRVGCIKDLLPKESMWNFRCLLSFAVIIFQQFAAAVIYFALSLKRDFISDNPYINAFCTGLLELPAYILAWIVTDKVGRKLSVIVCLALGGLTLVVLPFLDGNSPDVVYGSLAIFSKFLITVAFSVMTVHGAEVMPTTVRALSLFIASVFMSLGMFIAPEIGGKMDKMHPSLSRIIYGIVSVAAGVATLILPETRGLPMPNSIKDMYRLGVKLPCANRNDGTLEVDSPPDEDKSEVHQLLDDNFLVAKVVNNSD